MFLSNAHLDEELRSGGYNPATLGLTGPPIPDIDLPINLIYGEKEKCYMHWQGWEARWHRWRRNSKLLILPEADHDIANLGFWSWV